MNASKLTDHLVTQGRALVRAIEALGTIEPTGVLDCIAARSSVSTNVAR
jgi:hypothetical protein